MRFYLIIFFISIQISKCFCQLEEYKIINISDSLINSCGGNDFINILQRERVTIERHVKIFLPESERNQLHKINVINQSIKDDTIMYTVPYCLKNSKDCSLSWEYGQIASPCFSIFFFQDTALYAYISFNLNNFIKFHDRLSSVNLISKSQALEIS
jgi:hypothetical protein